MAQTKIRADLTAAAFPFLFEWAGRTVISPQGDGGNPPFPAPQIMYCQDVLPTQQGFKSVSYKDLVPAADPANLNFSNIFTVSDVAQNRALIGVTVNSHIYMLTSDSPLWIDVTPAGWAGGDGVTTGSANGVHYLYLANKGCYAVNIVGVSLTLTALTGITAANIVGMLSSINYLILFDATAIYWSSTLNPLDFVPSLITGAGTSTPFDEQGEIVAVKPLGNGFCVYTNSNAVIAQFSNNTQFPWIFRGADNVAGIATYKQVSSVENSDFHVALTSAGITQVTPPGGEIIVPELTDFLAARDIENYNFVTDEVEDIDLMGINPVRASIAIIAARYIVVSYGVTSYTDALVYDLVLKRWGKLHIPHVACFEIRSDMEGSHITYISLLGNTYASMTPQTYGTGSVTLNNPPIVGRYFGLLQADGTVKLVYLDYFSTNDNAVVILGKFQAVRNHLLEIQEIDVETISAHSNLSVRVISTLNGKDLLPAVTPTLVEDGVDVQIFKCRAVGKNHNIVFKGSFHLTTVEVTGVVGSRR